MSGIDEERIDRMRTALNVGMRDDVRRRGARVRKAIGGTVVAATLVVGIGTGQVLGTRTDDVGESGSSSEAIQSEPPTGGSSSEQLAPGDADMPQAAPTQIPNRAQQEPKTAREVIVTGSASVVGKDPSRSAELLSEWAESRNGRVDSRSTRGSGDDEVAELTVRVPSTEVTALLAKLKEYGKVSNSSTSGDDVTTQVRDLDGRIAALKVSIDRLEKLVAEAETTSDLINAERELTARQTQYESLLTERKAIGDQTALATIDVTFYADESAEAVDPGGFTGGLKDGWNALVNIVNGGVEALGAVLPFLAVLLVLLGGWTVVRRVRRATR